MPLYAEAGGAGTTGTQLDQLMVLALLALPLIGFALTALVGRRLGARSWIVAVAVMVVTWAIAMFLVYQTLIMGAFGEGGLHFDLYRWITAGDFQVDIDFGVDALTAVMLIVVTTVGMLVHVYSIGYMAHDPG
ncbi:MAG: hypothetical protein M3452_07725, partial [Chloroflexota bacterium]|nr:hypothetical protein [Chloroflexota bacterium]